MSFSNSLTPLKIVSLITLIVFEIMLVILVIVTDVMIINDLRMGIKTNSEQDVVSPCKFFYSNLCCFILCEH